MLSRYLSSTEYEQTAVCSDKDLNVGKMDSNIDATEIVAGNCLN